MNRFLFGLLLAITSANLFVYRKLLGNKMGALYMYRTWFFLLLTHSYCTKLIPIFHIHFLHKAFAKYGLSLCLMFAFPSSFIGLFSVLSLKMINDSSKIKLIELHSRSLELWDVLKGLTLEWRPWVCQYLNLILFCYQFIPSAALQHFTFYIKYTRSDLIRKAGSNFHGQTSMQHIK